MKVKSTVEVTETTFARAPKGGKAERVSGYSITVVYLRTGLTANIEVIKSGVKMIKGSVEEANGKKPETVFKHKEEFVLHTVYFAIPPVKEGEFSMGWGEAQEAVSRCLLSHAVGQHRDMLIHLGRRFSSP